MQSWALLQPVFVLYPVAEAAGDILAKDLPTALTKRHIMTRMDQPKGLGEIRIPNCIPGSVTRS